MEDRRCSRSSSIFELRTSIFGSSRSSSIFELRSSIFGCSRSSSIFELRTSIFGSSRSSSIFELRSSIFGCSQSSSIFELRSSIFRKAGNGTRTRDPNLGKVVLYQLSYSREVAGWRTPLTHHDVRTRSGPRRFADTIRPPDDGGEGNRTPDLLNAIQALSQLSYAPATADVDPKNLRFDGPPYTTCRTNLYHLGHPKSIRLIPLC